MRLADIYLMYAEAVLRGGGGGDAGTALTYVNKIVERGHGNNTGANITSEQLNLDFILDERARELFWEATGGLTLSDTEGSVPAPIYGHGKAA